MFTVYSGKIPANCVLLFSAPWCGPCKVMHPIIEKMAKEVIEVNVDHNSDLANKYGVIGVPTLIRIVNGQPIASMTGGGHSPMRIQEFIEGRN